MPILRAEITAALGMSEPDAGSDLAGLRTRAVRDGDRYVINGQKVWTSGAHDADVILAFVRTDPEASKHRGISVFLVPTDSPGLTRRPFGSFIEPDDLDFNEVFFDDVSVPAENLIGPLDDGWRVATGSLGHERAMLWLSFAERLDNVVAHGPSWLAEQGMADDPLTLDWFGDLVIDTNALRLLGYRTLAKARRAMESSEQSILKLLGSEAVQRGSLHMLESLGPDGLDRTRPSAPVAAPALRALRRQLVRPLPAELRRDDRRRHLSDPAQHHRRAGAGPPALNITRRGVGGRGPRHLEIELGALRQRALNVTRSRRASIVAMQST